MYDKSNQLRSCNYYLHYYTCRFALAHIHGKCRRSVILEYFGESRDQVEVVDECCDVCLKSNPAEHVDCSEEMKAIVHAVKEIPNKGEKKVRHVI